MTNHTPSFRDLAGAFVLAKILAVVAGAIYTAHGAPLAAATLLAHGLALLAFVGALRLRKATIPAPWVAESTCRSAPAAWLLLAMPLGLLLRWGSESLYLSAIWLIDPTIAPGEIRALGSGQTLTTPLDWLAIGIGALEEEFIYRVMLMGWLVTRLGWPAGLLLTGAAFGLIHANPIAFAAGVGLGLLYLLSRSLTVVALAHFAANLAHPFLASIEFQVDLDQGLRLAAGFGVALAIFTVASILWLPRAGVPRRSVAALPHCSAGS